MSSLLPWKPVTDSLIDSLNWYEIVYCFPFHVDDRIMLDDVILFWCKLLDITWKGIRIIIWTGIRIKMIMIKSKLTFIFSRDKQNTVGFST